MPTAPPDDPLPRVKTIAAVLLALAVVTAGAPAASAAPSSADFNPFDTEGGGGFVPGWLSFGIGDRLSYAIDSLNGPDPGDPTVEDHAQAADVYIEEHSAAFVGLANQCVPDDRDLKNYDVVKVKLTRGDSTAVRYVTGTVTNGTADSMQVVNKTDRTVDYTLTFTGYATTILLEDLKYTYQNYADPGECPDKKLHTRLSGRYATGFSWQEGDA